MATLFAMPKLGLNMVDGVIVRWLVKEGAYVKAGQTILEIETDKATQEVESPSEGVLEKILKQEGETVPCNAVMAIILGAGETLPVYIPDFVVEGVAPKAEIEVKVSSPTGEGASEHEITEATPARIPISPSAKVLAQELGVDIASIKPKGARIMREDVEAAYQTMQADKSGHAKDSRQELSSLRRKIAEHMSLSAHSVARVGLMLEANATALKRWRSELNQQGERVSYNILLTALVAKALKEFPYMNAQLEENAICLKHEINIGIAVDTERGLLVPVLHNADQKDVLHLQDEFSSLSSRALQGRSSPDDLQGGTFTITNLGSLEIESFLPMVNYPECAILGVGAIVKKVVVEDDQILVQPRIQLTLAFDHRIVDGAPAGRFLQRIKHLIETADAE